MNPSRIRLALLLIAAVVLGLVVTGCQTTKGLGKDMEKLGKKIQTKADK